MPSGKRKRKENELKNKGKAVAAPNILQEVRNWFTDRAPVVKFLLGFMVCLLLFYAFYYSSFYRNYLEVPFLNLQATISNLLLNALGYSTEVVETTILGGGFSVNIKGGCDGLEAMAILVSGILIFPISFRLKIPGLLVGVLLLLLLNLLRIAGLYMAGFHFSQAVFDILHIQGGFIIFTMISVLFWFIWMNWSLKQLQKTTAT